MRYFLRICCWDFVRWSRTTSHLDPAFGVAFEANSNSDQVKKLTKTAKDPAALQRHPSLMEIILCSHQCRSFKQFRAEGKRAASPPKPRPDLRPMSGLSSGLVSDCPRQRQHAAAVR